MLNMVGGVGQEHLPMTQITTQHAHVSFGPKGTSEEPVGMQALQPLAIEPIGLWATGDALRLTGVDQQDLHDCLKTMFPFTAGTMHTRVSPSKAWDLATAMKFLEQDLGYKKINGLYTIETGGGHTGTKEIYDVVVSNL